MNDEHSLRRMAGDYEIIQAIHIGDREIVLGEKPQSESGDKYMCAFCQQNELFAAYSEVMCSDNYAEMVKMFGERVTEQAEKTRVAMNKPKIQGIDDHPLTASDCTVRFRIRASGKWADRLEPDGRSGWGLPHGCPHCAGSHGADLR